MAKLLYITANPKPVDQSYSLTVGEAFLDVYRHENPNDEIVMMDLYQMDIPEIDTDVFSAWGKLQKGEAFDKLDASEKAKVQRYNELTDQFVGADKYVSVTPMWNFSIPPRMKMYIDCICVAGKTFKYAEQGPVGLLGDKAAVHIQSRGGVYSEGPAAGVEFGDRYLRAVMGFLGITNYHSIIIEGHAQMPGQAEYIKAKSIAQAQELARDFGKALVKA